MRAYGYPLCRPLITGGFIALRKRSDIRENLRKYMLITFNLL